MISPSAGFLPRFGRRLALVVVAVAPAAAQQATSQPFRVVYESLPRLIRLEAPRGELVSCNGVSGEIVIGVEDALSAIRDKIESGPSDEHAIAYWEQAAARVERGERTRRGNCSMPRQIIADALERGRAIVVDGASGAHLDVISKTHVAWEEDLRPASYGQGIGRVFAKPSDHAASSSDGACRGRECILLVPDERSGWDSVL